MGFARIVTPESWLSTWSGISSQASFERCGPEVTVPTLLIEYTGDQAAFPSDMAAIHQGLGATHKPYERVRGNHHGMALSREEASGQSIAGAHIVTWLRETMA